MSNDVIWEFSEGELDEETIHNTEGIIRIKFPLDYVACVKTNNGASPSLQVIKVEGRGEAVFESLLVIDEGSEYSITGIYDAICDRLVSEVYPFAEDPFGNYFCFDYRDQKKSNPKVVFWDHEISNSNSEQALHHVCDSFTDLLSLLYDPDVEKNK